MGRFVGLILTLFGIFIVFGLVAGAAYTAGLGAAGVVVAPAGTAAAPVVAYPWLGFGFGFGHFLGFLLVLFLFVALVRLAFGGGRRRHGHGYGPGWGPGWGPGYGHGPRGWGGDSAAGEGEGERHDANDPREAWIRSRLEDWHRTAHAADANASGGSASGPTEPPATA